jgi:uncharacterized protein YndB with AHSA1/START domain
VFPYLFEPEKLVQWVDGLSAVNGAPAGAPEVGTRVTAVYEVRGRRHEFESETTRIEPDRLLEGRTSARGWESLGVQELASIDGGTRLTVTCAYTYTSLVLRLFAPLIEWKGTRKLRRDLLRLKSVIEAES